MNKTNTKLELAHPLSYIKSSMHVVTDLAKYRNLCLDFMLPFGAVILCCSIALIKIKQYTTDKTINL